MGYLTYKIPATTLKEAISTGRDDTTVQNERKRVLADGVYYQGNEPGMAVVAGLGLMLRHIT